MNTDNHDDALFKVAVIKNNRDGDPAVQAFTITQLANKIAQPRRTLREYNAYHHHKAEEKRLNNEARQAKEAGDMEAAKALKHEAVFNKNLQNEIKDGPALMPYHYLNDIGYKNNAEGRRHRENNRITHWSLLQLDVESQISIEEIHQVLAPFEYLLWPTISHRPEDPRYRVILFLATPVVPQTAVDIILRIDALLPARNDITKKTQAIDPASTDLQGRLMYFPTWLAKHPEQYKSIHNHGRLVTPDDFALTAEQQAAVEDRVTRTTAAKQERVKTHQTIVKAQGSDDTVIERKGKFYLNPNGYVESDKGWVRIGDVTHKIPNISCPVHGDSNGSEFVSFSAKSQNVFLSCKHCGTIWADKQRPEETDTKAFVDLLGKFKKQPRPANLGINPRANPFLERTSPFTFDEDPTLLEQNDRFLDPKIMSLIKGTGITLIKSPKGTGKTEVLKPFITKCRKEDRSVLLIGHRVNLLRELSDRLDLDFYKDLSENETSEHMAICMDSLTRFDVTRDKAPDTIIIDESEQVFSHLTSPTMLGKRTTVFKALVWALQHANRVIVLDADLTAQMTLEMIILLRGKRVEHEPYLGVVNNYVFEGRSTVMYEDRHHLFADAVQAVRDGGRIFLSTNWRKSGADVFARVFEAMDKKVLLVSAVTTETNPDVISFMENTTEESKKYDVIICTPTVQTGVSIDNDHFTHVFGVFWNQVGTYQDIDQALSRVRRVNKHQVWVQQIDHKNPGKSEQEIHEEMLAKESEARFVIYGEESEAKLTKGEHLWASVYSRIMYLQQEWSRFKFEQFTQLRIDTGYSIQTELKDVQLASIGKEMYDEAKDMAVETHALDLWNATELDQDDFVKLEQKRTRTHEEHLQVERFRYKRVLDLKGQWTLEHLAIAVNQGMLKGISKLKKLINWSFDNRMAFDKASRLSNSSTFSDASTLVIDTGLLLAACNAMGRPYRELVELSKDAVNGKKIDTEITKEQLFAMAEFFEQNQKEFKRYLKCRITDPTNDKNLKKVWASVLGDILPLKTKKVGPKGEQKIKYFIDWEAKDKVLDNVEFE
jgi:hypothetical protein